MVPQIFHHLNHQGIHYNKPAHIHHQLVPYDTINMAPSKHLKTYLKHPTCSTRLSTNYWIY